MKLFKILVVVLITYLLATSALAEEKILRMSTTTSTQASGLLDILLPELEKDTGMKVKAIAKLVFLVFHFIVACLFSITLFMFWPIGLLFLPETVL